ncbi:hypothetical protein [Marinibactrum halimedae]|uniref:Uncharacterized protein n=1 Tax=Marinibactrum halimedae TaxID=1444977 RepID=A0AA37WPK5_9GAMM|nr:hypothetical protein [Marinibactrum halimedae]MCD9458487.1 hypothetical protein [Marinibactrum halimedae]GLS26182.1 hypothetical protein GCM10007877_18970 [Marinibactrum halimedae]
MEGGVVGGCWFGVYPETNAKPLNPSEFKPQPTPKLKPETNAKPLNLSEFKPQPTPKLKPKTKSKPSRLNRQQRGLYERILDGEFGSTFTLKRDLILAKVIPGGHHKIKPVIDQLLSDEKICRNGNQFELLTQ